jgi:protein-arginine kinase activator protein McsA
MEVKIAQERSFTDKNGKTFRTFKVFIEGRGMWISELDFQNHPNLLVVKQDAITLQEPIQDNYFVKKTKNQNGFFITLIPASKKPEDISKKEYAPQEVNVNTVAELLVEYEISTVNQKSKKSKKIEAENNTKNKSPQSIIMTDDQLVDEIDMTEGENNLLLNEKQADTLEIQSEKEGELISGNNNKPTVTISNIDLLADDKESLEKQKKEANSPIVFVTSLLEDKRIKSNHKEKLFKLTVEEIKKHVDVDKDLIKRVENLEETIKKESHENTIMGTDTLQRVHSHEPLNTFEFLRLFKYVDGSGFKELVHDTDFRIIKPEQILNKVKSHPNFINSELGIKATDYKPIHSFVQIETRILIEKFEKEGLPYIKETGKHPYGNHKGYTEFVENFKKKYRFGSGREYSQLSKKIADIVGRKKYNDFFKTDNIVFKPDLRRFDIRSNFLTWTVSVEVGIGFILDGIKDHSCGEGCMSSKRIEFECTKDTINNKLTIELLDVDAKAKEDPQNILAKFRNSNLYRFIFRSLCDWSVEFDMEGGSYCLNILNSDNNIEKNNSIVLLSNEVGGFKHVLRFFN